MKERKKTMVLVIVGIALCCAGIYIFMINLYQYKQNKLIPHIASYNVEKSQNGYVVSITDIHGKLLYEDLYQLEPIISEIGKDTVMVTAGKGDSIAYKFINRKSGKISYSYEK